MFYTLTHQLALAKQLGIINESTYIELKIDCEEPINIPRIRVNAAEKLFGKCEVYRTEITEGCGFNAKPTLLFYLTSES